jgi:hypothetical protein
MVFLWALTTVNSRREIDLESHNEILKWAAQGAVAVVNAS